MNTAIELFDVDATNHAIKAMGMPGTTSSQSATLGTVTSLESGCFATTYTTTSTAAMVPIQPITAESSTLEAN